MRFRNLIIACLVLFVFLTPAFGQGGGGTGSSKFMEFYQGTVRKGECKTSVFENGQFIITRTGQTCTVTTGPNVSTAGTCVGDNPNDWCAVIDTAGKTLEGTGASAWIMPVGTGTAPTLDGQFRFQDDRNQVEVGTDGTKTVRLTEGPIIRKIGGVEWSNDFTYAGEVTSPTDCSVADTSCARTVCRCGTCTGSNGSGKCSLQLNASNARGVEIANLPNVALLQVRNFTHTAGSVEVDTGTGVTPWRFLMIKASNDVTLSGGSMSLKGRGNAGTVASSSCTSTQVGWGGGSTPYNFGGGGGTSGGSGGAGSAGGSAFLDANTSTLLGRWYIIGTGGGAPRGTSPTNAAATPISSAPVSTNYAQFYATGGGGGGTGTCSGAVGAGGQGGGFIEIEAGGKITATSYTINVMGNDGTAPGGGGGGGGGAHLMASEIVGTFAMDTGTCNSTQPQICVGGGAGAASGTNIGAGAAGGDGFAVVETVPK